jgi:hypothetical protein
MPSNAMGEMMEAFRERSPVPTISRSCAPRNGESCLGPRVILEPAIGLEPMTC